MPRTTPELLATVTTVRLPWDANTFITHANALVEELLAPLLKADGVTPYHDATRLELIERYLAAWAYHLTVRRAQSEQAGAGGGQVSTTYLTKNDLGFDLNEFGQAAKRLDTSGTLARLDNSIDEVDTPIGRKRSATWLGTRPSNWGT